jgi:hypothetical protein
MTVARSFGFGLLGAVIGATTGAGAGLLGGIGYTSFGEVSTFEGYSGFVVGYWMLGGLVLGLIAGVPIGVSLSKRRQKSIDT